MAREWYDCPKCGEPIEVEGRNCADARRKAQWLAEQGRVCRKCQRAGMAEESARDAELSAAEGLPPLEGTEAQVRWAETLRRTTLRMLDEGEAKYVALAGASAETDEEEDAAVSAARGNMVALRGILEGEARASVWIDVRDLGLKGLVSRFQKEIAEALSQGAPPSPSDVPDDVLEEALLRPESPVPPVPVEVEVSPEEVCAVHPKDDRLMEVVKALRYSWRGSRWSFRVRSWCGPAEHRGAELIARLLAAGFMVSCLNAEARRLALSGEYEPMTYRWIVGLPDTGRIGMVCENSPDVYEFVKGTFWLTGNRGPMSVRFETKPERYDSIRELADRLGFRITPGAQALMDAAKTRVENALLVKDPKVKTAKMPEYRQGLEDGFGVADELRDE